MLVLADQLLGSALHRVSPGLDQDDLVEPRQDRNSRKYFAEQDHRPWTVRHQAREGDCR